MKSEEDERGGLMWNSGRLEKTVVISDQWFIPEFLSSRFERLSLVACWFVPDIPDFPI